jgi:hypothetical protein
MRFLVDASLPRSATALLQQMGHDAADVRDIGMGSVTDDVIAAHARRNRQTLVTRDFDFADIRNYRPADYAGTMLGSSCFSFPMTLPPGRWWNFWRSSSAGKTGSTG